ncbi:stem cell self-renewal protein Piwi [Coemansia reversa NRRL 1564]|uniref:Stem cell self-renewal protein Piwi n=1 Tax=Coemansia reversa (strain ATCC 12441 / NRRL 1564) TaxID=763665 RepID=A0A2G5B739_COERN|nr:stem cell self-renewal protein Piwi [Coemansia reversa NRRL 1564]|eukprot:PIA14828.1 stem cell self-renewal protein Piwi [Coemansia reversa NRRL 1564]
MLAHGSTGSAVYGEIKRIAHTQIGVQTQCVRYQKARGHHPRLLTQILLKINVKLGGNNSAIVQGPTASILDKQTTLVLSADVCHASFAAHQPMSIVGVVWSMDKQAQRFAGAVVQHPQRMEIIENLDVIMRYALRSFYAKTGSKPQRIMYYRDGANESQVSWIRQVELTGIRRACKLIDPDYVPSITAIIARKRHHARFMLPQENCRPGTVVQDWAAPQEQSFFMLTHRALFGVSKPVHYIVLQNDAIGNDQPPTLSELQTLTYQLAYQYPIVTRPTTMPASLYYAHRLASRGRMQLNRNPIGRGTLLHLIPVHERLQNTMYFL